MKVIYTAITNNYDTLLTQPDFPNVQYVVFTDNKDLQSDQWEVRYIPNIYHKAPKILSHQYLPEATQSLWIDGNIQLNNKAIKLFKHRKTFNCFNAKDRHCAYEEAEECKKAGYITQEESDKAIRWLNKHKHPKQAGLISAGVILRNNTNKDFEKEWYRLVKTVCKRDQVTVNYSLNKHKIKPNYFKGSIYKNDYCKWNIWHGNT